MVRGVPVVGVRVMPRMLTLKERMEGLAGRVSATSVRLTVASPLITQVPVHLFGTPLHAAKNKVARRSTTRNGQVLMRFMWPPRQNSMRSPSLERKTLTIPKLNVTRGAGWLARQKQLTCSTLKRTESKKIEDRASCRRGAERGGADGYAIVTGLQFSWARVKGDFWQSAYPVRRAIPR